MSPKSGNFLERATRFVSLHTDGASLVFLAALTALVFLKYLHPQASLVLSLPGQDLDKQFIWWREFGFAELRKGHLALWNPKLFCGAPYFGGFQSGLLYPLNWIFLFLPLAFALNLSMALHVFLAGAFTYVWVRGRGLHPAAALAAALMYMFSGAVFVMTVVGFLCNLCAMAWIPLVFWAVDGWKRERQARWIAWGGVLLALQFFSGHIQVCYYTALAVGFYSAAVLFKEPRRFQFLAGIGGFYALGFLLSAVQLLTGWDAVKESVRNTGMVMYQLDMMNLTPERFCTLLMPYFYGGWRDYWGGGFYPEGNLFVTVTGFLLALFSWKASGDPERKIFACMGLLVMVLMVGTHTPLFGVFCRYFPLFDRFRGASKLNILLVFCLALLAALAYDAVLKNTGILQELARPLALGGGLFLLASALFFLAPRMGGAKLFRQFIDHAGSMTWTLFYTGLFLSGLSLLSRETARHPSLKWAFGILILFESLWFARANLTGFDLGALRQKMAPIQQTYDRDPGDYRVWMDLDDYTLGSLSGLDIWGEDPMVLRRFAEFAVQTQGYDFERDFQKRPFFEKITPSLGLLRLRYIFREQGDHVTVERPKGLQELPRAFFVHRVEKLSREAILQKTAALGFDPLQEALVEEDPGIGLSGQKPEGSVRVKDLSTDAVEIQAVADRPALLVLTDNYSSGWKIKPEEGMRETPGILPVNGFQMGIPLGAGKYHFILEYRPTAFVVGKWISTAAWVLFLGFLAWEGFRKDTRIPKGTPRTAPPG